MDDLISRQEAIDAIEFGITYARAINKETGEVKELFQEGNDELKKAVQRVKELPAADAVPVVRCRDCKHSEHWYRDKRRCFLWHETGIDVFEDGYCNYAERKTDDVRD